MDGGIPFGIPGLWMIQLSTEIVVELLFANSLAPKVDSEVKAKLAEVPQIKITSETALVSSFRSWSSFFSSSYSSLSVAYTL